jgi:hypothetical protein
MAERFGRSRRLDEGSAFLVGVLLPSWRCNYPEGGEPTCHEP